MTIDATFWVAVSFFIFLGILVYLKVPQKINNSLTDKINEMKKELNDGERLKFEAKNLLSNYEKETQNIINLAKKNLEKNILEKTKKFHQLIENKKKNTEQKIIQAKENALKDIKNISIKISIEAVEHLIKNSIDENKITKLHTASFEQAKTSLKDLKT